MPTPGRGPAATLEQADGRPGRLRRLLLDAGPLVVSRYAAAAISLLTTIVATRWLGVGGFGEASLALAFPLLLWSVTSIKSVSITTRYLSSFRLRGESDNISGICQFGYLVDLAMAVGAALVVAASASAVATRVYGLPELRPLMLLLAGSFPLWSLVGTNEAILTAYQRFGVLALLVVLESVLRLLFVLAGWYVGGGSLAYVAATAASQVLIGLLGFAAAAATLSADLGKGWRHRAPLGGLRQFRRELWGFVGWNYVLVTMSGFLDQVPAMLLGAFSGASSVAYYRLASNLTVTVGYVEASLRRAVYPTLLADWNAGGLDRLRRDVRAMTARVGLPTGFLIVLGGFAVVPYAVTALFGQDFEGMVLGTQLMISSAGVSTALFWLHPYYFSSGRIALWSKIYLVYGVVFLLIAWPVASVWSFLGVAALVAAGRIVLAGVGVGVAQTRWFARA